MLAPVLRAYGPVCPGCGREFGFAAVRAVRAVLLAGRRADSLDKVKRPAVLSSVTATSQTDWDFSRHPAHSCGAAAVVDTGLRGWWVGGFVQRARKQFCFTDGKYRTAAARCGSSRFTVLGMLALADGSESVVLQPSRPAALLAALLLNANSVVSVDFLQRVIWGEETPAQGKSALHSCVLRLRRLFGKYGIAGNMIEAVPGGYRLTADAATLDLVRFRELLGAAYATGNPEAELRLLRDALALWQPPLLANVPSDLLHRDELPKLQEEWLRAIERVFDLELECGRHREALADIWSTARAYPLHERFTEQLMEALDRAGRRAEALAEYRRLKSYLAQALGVDPGSALQRLELAILRGESPSGQEPVPPRRTPAPPTAAPAAHPGADPVVGEPVDGGRVLDALVGAGLLEEGPRGLYRVHELLRVFTRAAAAGGVGARAPPPGPAPPPSTPAARRRGTAPDGGVTDMVSATTRSPAPGRGSAGTCSTRGRPPACTSTTRAAGSASSCPRRTASRRSSCRT